MAKYVLVYHGGATPETEENVAAVMAAWETWMESLGGALTDPGNATGNSATVHSDGTVVAGGGANPASGYSLLDAGSLDDAVELAKGCPIFESGGSIEVAETIEM
jgi:hypothetical protein